MRVLITGAQGQLAKSIIPVLAQRHILYDFDKSELDITCIDVLESKLIATQPDYVLNLAAYNNVDLAQIKQKLCDNINYHAVKQLAILTKKYNIRLIHISSNYVFPSQPENLYSEQDSVRPMNHYGLSKRQGELAILNAHPQAIIIRTSSLHSAFNSNFVTKIIQQIQAKKTISVIDDSFTQPTSCHELALFIQYLIQKSHNITGLIHFTGETIYSWFHYAQLIADTYCQHTLIPAPKIIAITTQSKTNIRPQYALLDNTLAKQLYRPSAVGQSTSLLSFDYIKNIM